MDPGLGCRNLFKILYFRCADGARRPNNFFLQSVTPVQFDQSDELNYSWPKEAQPK